MKRNLILLAAAIGIVAISTGCSSQDTQVLESKISQLEQQLSSQNAANNAASQNASTNIMPSSSALSQSNLDTHQTTNFDTTELTEKVNTIVQLADSSQPRATYQENYSLYNQIKMQIKQVEFEIEQFEHQIESASRTGALSYTQYQELDRIADQLDHRLDMAKDSLEFRLGVDD